MRVDKWIVASVAVVMMLATGGCKPKLGAKCKAGQSYCTKEGALMCGEDNKLAATGCHGPNGCVQHGTTAACDQSLAQVGEACEDPGNIACTVDKKGELDCKDHKWVLGATCKGAKGCELKGDELFCDHTLADKDDPCHKDGHIACTNDKTFILRCEDNIFRAIDSCRGPKGCTFEEHPEREIIEFGCDDSVATEGDPCASENFHACSVDKKAIHVCRDKKFVQIKACTGPKGCQNDEANRRLTCDTGGGNIFSGAGGSAKVSAASGSAGSAKAKAGATAGSATAKVAGSASVGAAPAKPDAGVVAAAAGADAGAGAKPDAGAVAAGADAGAKPGADAGAKAGTAKPVPTVKKR